MAEARISLDKERIELELCGYETVRASSLLEELRKKEQKARAENNITEQQRCQEKVEQQRLAVNAAVKYQYDQLVTVNSLEEKLETAEQRYTTTKGMCRSALLKYPQSDSDSN